MRTPLGFIGLFFGLCRFGTMAAGADENAKPVVTLAATVDVTDETATKPGLIQVTRSGDLSGALAVGLDVKGSAKAGIDYHDVPRSVTVPAGEASATLEIIALGDFDKQPTRTVVLNLKP